MFKIRAFSSISVSVIMAIFNKAHYLKRSIGTLKNQTNKNFELIAVDDCSSDNSSEFITNMIKTDSRIKLIQHIYNQGTTASKNHAILSSNGHYIMQLDPDDEFVSTSIENAYKAASFVDADILEYELSVKFLGNIMNLPNYTIPTCKTNNSNGNEPLLTKFQRFKYDKTNWNTCKKIIKRTVYVQSVRLLLPFVENKRICNADDLLHTGAVYIFMKNYFCGNFLAYIYYKALPDSQTGRGYVSRKQTHDQTVYTRFLVSYFYHNRNNLSNCKLEDFLSNPKNVDIYNKIVSIDKKPIKNCSCNLIDFICEESKEMGFYLISRK